jgi:hypothetical protein
MVLVKKIAATSAKEHGRSDMKMLLLALALVVAFAGSAFAQDASRIPVGWVHSSNLDDCKFAMHAKPIRTVYCVTGHQKNPNDETPIEVHSLPSQSSPVVTKLDTGWKVYS